MQHGHHAKCTCACHMKQIPYSKAVLPARARAPVPVPRSTARTSAHCPNGGARSRYSASTNALCQTTLHRPQSSSGSQRRWALRAQSTGKCTACRAFQASLDLRA